MFAFMTAANAVRVRVISCLADRAGVGMGGESEERMEELAEKPVYGEI